MSLLVRPLSNDDIGVRAQLAPLITVGLVLLAIFFLLPTLYSCPNVSRLLCLYFPPRIIIWSDLTPLRFAMTLFAEVQHDFVHYYKYIVVIQTSAPNLRV